MSKVKCSEAGRECVYGGILKKETVHPETVRVVDKTIGYDDIAHEEKTGRYVKTTIKYKVCKYCGNEVILDRSSKVVNKKVTYE